MGCTPTGLGCWQKDPEEPREGRPWELEGRVCGLPSVDTPLVPAPIRQPFPTQFLSSSDLQKPLRTRFFANWKCVEEGGRAPVQPLSTASRGRRTHPLGTSPHYMSGVAGGGLGLRKSSLCAAGAHQMSALMPSVLAREQGARTLASSPHVPQPLPSAVGSGLLNVPVATPCGYACLPRLSVSGGAPPPTLPSALQRAPLPPLCDILPGGTVSSGWLRPVTNRSPACTPLSYSLIRHLNPQALPQPLPPPPGLGPGPLTPSRSHASCHSCALEPQQFQ